MLTEEQEKALLKRLISSARIKRRLSAGLLRWSSRCTGSGKVFGRMSEKNLPLDPNQLFLFSKEEMSSMEISRMEDEVRKSDEEITRTIKVKEKPSASPWIHLLFR